MKRIVALALGIFMTTAIFTGCGNKAQTSKENTSATVSTVEKSVEQEEQSTQNTSQFPLTVKDANGFEMKIEKKPEAIVSLTLGSDEMLMGMVDAARIKSLTAYSDDAAISNIVEAAKAVKDRAGSEAEKIIALGPDLVFTDTWSKPEFVQQLRDANITVYVFKTPSSIDEQKTTIKELANVVGENAKGDELVAWMDAKLKEIDDKVSTLAADKKLKVMDYGEMGSSGKGTNFDSILQRAGLINVVAEAGIEFWQTISKEKIVEFNPDIMIIPSWYYDQKNTLESFKASIMEDKSLATVNAVKNDKLIALPNPHVSAISQYVVLGVEDMAKAVYPDLFK